MKHIIRFRIISHSHQKEIVKLFGSDLHLEYLKSCDIEIETAVESYAYFLRAWNIEKNTIIGLHSTDTSHRQLICYNNPDIPEVKFPVFELQATVPNFLFHCNEHSWIEFLILPKESFIIDCVIKK